MPRVLNKYKDFIPPGAVSIMRPGKWGNPFTVMTWGDRDTVVDNHERWFLSNPDLIKQAK